MDDETKKIMTMMADCEQKQKKILDNCVVELDKFIIDTDTEYYAAKALVSSMLCIHHCLKHLQDIRDIRKDNPNEV